MVQIMLLLSSPHYWFAKSSTTCPLFFLVKSCCCQIVPHSPHPYGCMPKKQQQQIKQTCLCFQQSFRKKMKIQLLSLTSLPRNHSYFCSLRLQLLSFESPSLLSWPLQQAANCFFYAQVCSFLIYFITLKSE